jgi:hypothetical protein
MTMQLNKVKNDKLSLNIEYIKVMMEKDEVEPRVERLKNIVQEVYKKFL